MRHPPWPLLCAAALTGCSHSATPVATEAPRPTRSTVASASPAPRGPITLSILATNDVHGQLGKLPVLAGYVANLRKARERDGGMLLLDGGDIFQGTIESNSTEGAAMIAAYNAIGYQASAIGNHEFDFGPAGPKGLPEGPDDDPQGALITRIAEARFPFLSANLRTETGSPPAWTNFAPSTIVDVAGVRVGIIGLLTADAPDIVKRPLFRNLRVVPLAETAAAEATRLRTRGAEVVVVVAHAGGSCTSTANPEDTSSCEEDSEIFRLARALSGSVDALIGGHRNAAVAHVVKGVPVAHAPSYLVAFSRIDLVLDRATRKVIEHRVLPPHPLCANAGSTECAPGDYEGAPVLPVATVEQVIAPALEAARAVGSRPIGVRVEAGFQIHKAKETALGNLFADAMLDAVPGSDAAFANAGSIRDALPQGDLTLGQLYHVMPFDNQLARLKMSGADLRNLLRVNVTQSPHGLLSVAGLEVSVRCDRGKVAIDVTRKNGRKVTDTEQLSVITSDFLAWGGDGLLRAIAFPDDRVALVPGQKVIDALARGLAARKTVAPTDPKLLNPHHPRIRLPKPIPVTCTP